MLDEFDECGEKTWEKRFRHAGNKITAFLTWGCGLPVGCRVWRPGRSEMK